MRREISHDQWGQSGERQHLKGGILEPWKTEWESLGIRPEEAAPQGLNGRKTQASSHHAPKDREILMWRKEGRRYTDT